MAAVGEAFHKKKRSEDKGVGNCVKGFFAAYVINWRAVLCYTGSFSKGKDDVLKFLLLHQSKQLLLWGVIY